MLNAESAPSATRPVAGRTAIRVLFDHQITAVQRYGGVSRYVLALLRQFAQLPQVSAQLAAPAHVNDYIATSDALHALSFRLTWPRRGLGYRVGAAEPLFRLAAAISRPDLIHETGYMPQAASRAKGPRIVTTLHDMIVERYPDLFEPAAPLIAAKRAALRRADAIICVSENTRRDLLAHYPEHEHKASVVWHGVDPGLQMAVAPPVLQQPYLLFVGVRRGYKNFERLVRAYGASRRLVDGFRLLCFGGGPLQAAERALCAQAGVADDRLLQIEGDDTLMAQAYRHARLFVFPSQYEGFGMPLTEAMAQACAVVCSDASSFREIAGEACAYFDPLDIESMRAALEAVAFDDQRQAALSAAARQRAALFSWRRCALETAAVYARVVDRAG